MNKLGKQTDTTLEKELGQKRSALQSFRFGSSGSKTRNVREGRNLRKEIARLLTELNARKHQATSTPSSQKASERAANNK